jgi:hypothetical protein
MQSVECGLTVVNAVPAGELNPPLRACPIRPLKVAGGGTAEQSVRNQGQQQDMNSNFRYGIKEA